MNLKSILLSFIRKESFQPSLLAVFFNPFFFIRRGLFLNIKELAPSLKGKLLDFGCGRKPYENLFSVQEYIGMDMESTGHEHKHSKIDVFYNGRIIPFEQETFDSVFCSEVFEHVFNLDEVLQEINRVMKKGGQILITVPFCWNEHEIPYDFARYSSFGIKYILENSGFEVIKSKKSGNFARVIWQLWAVYFYALFNTNSKMLNYFLRMLFIVPVNVSGLILLNLFPKNKSLYFNNIVLAKKVETKKN